MIEIKHEIPDIFVDCAKHFGVKWEDVIITYYPYIYSPVSITEAKYYHEATHILQQKEYGVKEWWARYFQDKEFRLSQEVEAYKNEKAFIQENIKNREERFKLTIQIYRDLSGSTYGNLVTYEEAKKLLE
jgi:hypothetical protein